MNISQRRDPVHPGKAVHGKFIPDDAEFFKWDFSNYEGRRVEVTVRGERRKPEHNSYYWAVINKTFVIFFNQEKSFGRVVTPQFVHEILCAKFLGFDRVMLPGGQVIDVPNTTRGLSTGDFNDFVKWSKSWGEEFFSLYFPEDPEK